MNIITYFEIREMIQNEEWNDVLTRYEGVSRSFRTESIMKYTLTTINTR